MTSLRGLPELGVGLIYWPRLSELIRLDELPIDVIEVEPQPFWFAPSDPSRSFQLDRRSFDHLKELPLRKLIHGVGFPVGGTVAPDPRQIGPFVESIELLGAPWASEHLSFNRIQSGDGSEIDVGFLLPPLQSSAGVAVAEANIKLVRSHLPVPFAFETGVSYLQPQPGELSDGAFFASVAAAADCGILLDLHNLWANERNGRQKVLDVVNELPLERVIELHLAGGDEYRGYWVDAHSGLVPPEVMNLARRVVPQLPNLKAIIYEVMPEYVQENRITQSQMSDQFEQMRELWDMRGIDIPRRDDTPVVPPAVQAVHLTSPGKWETDLAAAVTTPRSIHAGMLDNLRADPGVSVLRNLIGAVRAGKVADTLPLTTRLLLLTLGETALQEILDEFWISTPSEQMSSQEALNFASHLRDNQITARVDHLHAVVDLELAAHKALMTGDPQIVFLSVDPELLLSALRRGVLPVALESGDFEITLTPPVDGRS